MLQDPHSLNLESYLSHFSEAQTFQLLITYAHFKAIKFFVFQDLRVGFQCPQIMFQFLFLKKGFP